MVIRYSHVCQVEGHVRSLKSLGIAPKLYSSLLSPILMKKLQQELYITVSKRAARERANATASTARKPSHDRPTAMSLTTANSFTPSCSYCGEHHSSVSCKEATRWKRLQILWQMSQLSGKTPHQHLWYFQETQIIAW